jgi:hypothetical protein
MKTFVLRTQPAPHVCCGIEEYNQKGSRHETRSNHAGRCTCSFERSGAGANGGADSRNCRLRIGRRPISRIVLLAIGRLDKCSSHLEQHDKRRAFARSFAVGWRTVRCFRRSQVATYDCYVVAMPVDAPSPLVQGEKDSTSHTARSPSGGVSRINASRSRCSSVSFSKSFFAARSRTARRALRIPWVR